MDVSKPSWFNFFTETYSFVEPDTDEIARQYIPQSIAAQGAYGIYRDLGLSALQSIANVLSIAAGEPKPFPTPPASTPKPESE